MDISGNITNSRRWAFACSILARCAEIRGKITDCRIYLGQGYSHQLPRLNRVIVRDDFTLSPRAIFRIQLRTGLRIIMAQ